jgi:predicted metal-dependent peptidase
MRKTSTGVRRYYIYVNPAFCSTLNQDEIAFVFAHEVMHCVLGHIDRRGDRRHDLWNDAIDYATNLMLVELGLRMPKVGLFDRAYRGMTAEDIYQRLVQQADQRNLPNPGAAGNGSKQAGQDSLKEPGSPSGWDLHIPPDDPRGQSVRAREFPSAEERKRMRVSITRAMGEKLRGTAAGLFEAEIRQARGGQVPWRTLVARFFTGLRRDDYRLMPPNKKHLWRGIYLPAMGVPGPNHIVAAVDTSGSMSDKDLGEILGELDKLRSVTECRLTLTQCDAKIQKVDEFDAWTSTRFDRYRFHGRGGTAFEPVFDWIREQAARAYFQPDALIYLTDGFGSFPKKPPPYPVLWIMTEHCRPDVPFGEVIRMRAGTASPS